MKILSVASVTLSVLLATGCVLVDDGYGYGYETSETVYYEESYYTPGNTVIYHDVYVPNPPVYIAPPPPAPHHHGPGLHERPGHHPGGPGGHHPGGSGGHHPGGPGGNHGPGGHHPGGPGVKPGPGGHHPGSSHSMGPHRVGPGGIGAGDTRYHTGPVRFPGNGTPGGGGHGGHGGGGMHRR